MRYAAVSSPSRSIAEPAMSHAAAAETDALPPPAENDAPPPPAEIDEERPLGMDLPRRVKVLVLAGSMLAMFLASLEQSVVNPALPQIVAELGGLDLFPWLVQAFLIAQIIAIPIAGALSDAVGRKPLLLVGLLIFLGGSAGCGAAGGIYELIAFRAMQGAGAGVLMTSTFSVMGDLFPASERGKYVGLFAGIFALSGVIGAPLGGALTEAISWRWVFWIMFFVGPIAWLVIAWKMPWLRPPRRALRFDWLGTALLLPMLMPALVGVSFGGELGWTSPLVLALFAVSALTVALFIAVERRAAVPIVPIHLFRINTIASATTAMFVIGVGMMGVMVYMQFFLQVGLGANAAEAGSVMMPMIVISVATAVIGGQLMSRTGRYKLLAISGGLLMLAGMALLSTMTSQTTIGGVLARLVPFGIGMGLMMPVLSLATQNAAPQRYLGRVSGFTQFFQLTGGAIGIGVIGALFNARLASSLQSSLPADLVDVISPAKLVDPEFESALIAEIGRTAWEVVEPAVQGAVAIAITDNFLLAVGVLVVAVLAILRMREVPLKTGEEGRLVTEQPADAPPPAPLPIAEPIAAAVETAPPLPVNGAAVEPVPVPAPPLVSIEEPLAPIAPPAPVRLEAPAPVSNGAQPPAARWTPSGRGVAAAAFVGASLGLALSYAWSGNGSGGRSGDQWAAARQRAAEWITPRRTPPAPRRTRRR